MAGRSVTAYITAPANSSSPQTAIASPDDNATRKLTGIWCGASTAGVHLQLWNGGNRILDLDLSLFTAGNGVFEPDVAPFTVGNQFTATLVNTTAGAVTNVPVTLIYSVG